MRSRVSALRASLERCASSRGRGRPRRADSLPGAGRPGHHGLQRRRGRHEQDRLHAQTCDSSGSPGDASACPSLRAALHLTAMMPHVAETRPDGTPGATAQPGGAPARNAHTADVRADPRGARALRPGERPVGQAHVRTGQGPAAGVRGSAAAGGHRRVGDRAGVRHPQGRVLPSGDRLHARGARRPPGRRAERGGETPRRACRPQAALRRGRRGAGRPGRADRSHRARTHAARWWSPPPRRRSAGGGSGSAIARPQGRAGERDVDAYAMVFRGGHWYLVGFDAERDGVRAFRLSRFTSEIVDEGRGERATGRVPGLRPRGVGSMERRGAGEGDHRVLARGRLVGRRTPSPAPRRRRR